MTTVPTGTAAGTDGEPGTGPDDRMVKVSTTLGGAGVIRGALTPECAEFVTTVLDALSAPAGADDDRSHEQRYHDALEEAMRRLVAAGLVPTAGRAAAEGVGLYLAGRPDAAAGQRGAGGRVGAGS